MVLTSQVHTPWLLLLTYSLMLSMGTGPTFGIANTTTSRWFDRKRGFFLGITASGGGLGAIVFAPFATYLISSFDWRTAFLVIGLLSGLILIAVSFLFVRDPSDLGLLPDGIKAEPRKKESSNAPCSGKRAPVPQAFHWLRPTGCLSSGSSPLPGSSCP